MKRYWNKKRVEVSIEERQFVHDVLQELVRKVFEENYALSLEGGNIVSAKLGALNVRVDVSRYGKGLPLITKPMRAAMFLL